MAEIFIDSLTVENFGPFYGKHIFDFRPFDGHHATLIGGKNGAGKTHLMRALYLAAVGHSGSIDLKKVESGSDATKFILEESLNRKARYEGIDNSSLEITLTKRDDTGTTGRSLTIARQIRHRPSSPPVFHSKARLSGEVAWIDDEDKVQRFRDSFLPRHLARFFFFDAERGQSIQLSENEITDGISRVLGLYSYSELEEDLRLLTTNKIPKLFGSGIEAERKLNDIQLEIIKCQKNRDVNDTEAGDLKLELRETEVSLTKVEDDLKGLGTVDPLEVDEARARREGIAQSKMRLQGALETAWEIALPLALMSSFRAELYGYLLSEERKRDWDNKKSSVEPKIPQITRDVFGEAGDKYILSGEQRQYYADRLVSALQSLFNPPPEGMSERLFVAERNEISAQIRLRLQTSTVEIVNLSEACIELEEKSAELREIDQRLKQLQQNRMLFSVEQSCGISEKISFNARRRLKSGWEKSTLNERQ